MLRNNIIEIFGQTWPTLLICMVIIISLRVVYLIKNKEKIILHRELITIAFITYVLCLFYVVTFQDVSWSTSNLVPFKEIFRYKFGIHPIPLCNAGVYGFLLLLLLSFKYG